MRTGGRVDEKCEKNARPAPVLTPRGYSGMLSACMRRGGSSALPAGWTISGPSTMAPPMRAFQEARLT